MTATGTQHVVSCVLALDGSERVTQQWTDFYLPRILGVLHEITLTHAKCVLDIATVVINSLAPSSRRPIVIRPFIATQDLTTSLSNVLLANGASAKGRHRVSNSGNNYAVLEGLYAAVDMLEARRGNPSVVANYIVLASAYDIPDATFSDDLFDSLVTARLPDTTGSSALETHFGLRKCASWQDLLKSLTKGDIHMCLVSASSLPKLEGFQRSATTAKGVLTQTLPSHQTIEQVVLLSGTNTDCPLPVLPSSTASAGSKRRRQESSSRVGQVSHGSLAGSDGPHPTKKMRMSPIPETKREEVSSKEPKLELSVDRDSARIKHARPSSEAVESLTMQANSLFLENLHDGASLGAAPTSYPQTFIPMSHSQPAIGNDGIMRSDVESNANTVPPTAGHAPISMQELGQKREEVKSQMRQFMLHLANMAKTGQITLERAKHTAEKVKAEALKKIHLLDSLEASNSSNPPPATLGPTKAIDLIDESTSPSLQVQTQQRQLYAPDSASQWQPAPNLPPMWSNAQETASGDRHPHTLSVGTSQSSADSLILGMPPLNATAPAKNPLEPQHQFVEQVSLEMPTPSSPPRPAGPIVWSGFVQWQLMDPNTKTRRELAFYVDAIPLRAGASTELLNMPWPRVMDISHIAQMQVAELQKYAQDNRIQVIQLVRPEVDRLSSVGTSKVQNDQLYQILAKGLEQKGSVGIVKLPVSNRGIVIVALPNQGKLVGLIFLNTPLPPRIPSAPTTFTPPVSTVPLYPHQQSASTAVDATSGNPTRIHFDLQSNVNPPLPGQENVAGSQHVQQTAATGQYSGQSFAHDAGQIAYIPTAAITQPVQWSDAQFQAMFASLQNKEGQRNR